MALLVEVEYLLRPWPRAFPALLADFESDALELLDLPPPWLLRAGEVLARYRDLSLGLWTTATLPVVRPAHAAALTLLPEIGPTG